MPQSLVRHSAYKKYNSRVRFVAVLGSPTATSTTREYKTIGRQTHRNYHTRGPTRVVSAASFFPARQQKQKKTHNNKKKKNRKKQGISPSLPKNLPTIYSLVVLQYSSRRSFPPADKASNAINVFSFTAPRDTSPPHS